MFSYYCLCFFFIFFKNSFCVDPNVTCSDGRICFIIETIEEHCEIYIGSQCFPPCELEKCAIKVENNVLCDRYDCTSPVPKPSSTFWKDSILGAFGSFCTSCIFYLLWKCCKNICKRTVAPNENDDERGLIDGQFINEDEGNAETRPIIRHQYEPDSTTNSSTISCSEPPKAQSSPIPSTSKSALSSSLPSTSAASPRSSVLKNKTKLSNSMANLEQSSLHSKVIVKKIDENKTRLSNSLTNISAASKISPTKPSCCIKDVRLTRSSTSLKLSPVKKKVRFEEESGPKKKVIFMKSLEKMLLIVFLTDIFNRQRRWKLMN